MWYESKILSGLLFFFIIGFSLSLFVRALIAIAKSKKSTAVIVHAVVAFGFYFFGGLSIGFGEAQFSPNRYVHELNNASMLLYPLLTYFGIGLIEKAERKSRRNYLVARICLLVFLYFILPSFTQTVIFLLD